MELNMNTDTETHNKDRQWRFDQIYTNNNEYTYKSTEKANARRINQGVASQKRPDRYVHEEEQVAVREQVFAAVAGRTNLLEALSA